MLSTTDELAPAASVDPSRASSITELLLSVWNDGSVDVLSRLMVTMRPPSWVWGKHKRRGGGGHQHEVFGAPDATTERLHSLKDGHGEFHVLERRKCGQQVECLEHEPNFSQAKTCKAGVTGTKSHLFTKQLQGSSRRPINGANHVQ